MSAMCCPYHHLGGTPEARCARLAPDGSVWEVIDPPALCCPSCGTRVTIPGAAPGYAGDVVADAARAVGWSGVCDPAGYLAVWRQCAADTGTSAVLVPRTHATPLDAARIRLVRVGLGLNQAAMGRLFGVGPRSVSRWETGGLRPTPQQDAVLERLARALPYSGVPALVLEHPPVVVLSLLLARALVQDGLWR